MLHTNRFEVTTLHAGGQDKGHVIVVDDLAVDFMFPAGSAKQELALVGPSASSGRAPRIFVGLQPIHSEDQMCLDIQSLINLHPFFQPEHLLAWAQMESELFLSGIRNGRLEKVLNRLTGSSLSSLPLTSQARRAREAFDPLEDDPGLDCISPGMPRPMRGPHPVQFIDNGDEIELLVAEFDVRRIIHLNGEENPQSVPLTKQGYSRGAWSGNTLEVHTGRVDWPFFDGTGTPQSQAVEMVEHFSLSDDERRLDYEITITDPATFTEPVTMALYWVDLGEPMEIYNCVAGE